MSFERNPPLQYRVNTLRTSVEDVVKWFEERGLRVERGYLLDYCIRVYGWYNIDEGPVQRGLIIPQNEAAAFAGILLDPRPNERILDMCAAPGGKTTHLAQLTCDKAKIVALDISRDRVERLSFLVRACNFKSIDIVLTDALAFKTLRQFDAILLDPPCSSTGALEKNPEVIWRLTPSRLKKIIRLQKKLLLKAADLVKKNGRILYCTCSVLPDENEKVVEWFLGVRRDFELVELTPHDPVLCEGMLRGTLRTWPHRAKHLTGMFYAMFVKKR